MKLDEGKSVVKSFCGSFCTIFLFTILLAYATQKIDILINRKNVDILSTVIDLQYSDADIFGYKNGFNIAAAFTGFNNET